MGPLFWEQPFGDVELPPGDAPLVLVAPSTSQDPEQRLLRAAVEGLAGEDVRVLATTNRRPPPEPIPVPANTRLVEWVSYERTMPRCDVVVCHGGHGTVARALASGAVVVVVPAAGDMNENGARVDWAGVGVRLPRRLATPGAVRLAVRAALSDPRLRARARELAAWSAGHDGAARAAGLVERLAQRTRREPGGRRSPCRCCPRRRARPRSCGSTPSRRGAGACSALLEIRVVMNARLPPAITNVAPPSLRSLCSQRIFEWRLGSAKVVSVPRHSSSVAGQLIATTIVPRRERGLESWGCGLVVSVSEDAGRRRRRRWCRASPATSAAEPAAAARRRRRSWRSR